MILIGSTISSETRLETPGILPKTSTRILKYKMIDIDVYIYFMFDSFVFIAKNGTELWSLIVEFFVIALRLTVKVDQIKFLEMKSRVRTS